MAEQPAPNLFERIAKAGYEATRAWCDAGGGTPRAPWHKAEAWRRESAVEGTKRALAGATPEQLHEAWRKDRINRGWKYGQVRNAGAQEDPHLKPYAELSDGQKRKPDLFVAVAQIIFRCGKERWDVKTMTDPAAGTVNIDEPKKKEIAELIGLEAPVQPVERQPGELMTYELEGTITLAKLEADKDIHMVLGDGAGNTMIIEAVSPDCAETSRVLDQINAVRQAVEAKFPGAAAGAVEEGLVVPARVTGVAFFDRLHGQDGVAPNGIELHPLLSFQPTGEVIVPGPPGLRRFNQPLRSPPRRVARDAGATAPAWPTYTGTAKFVGTSRSGVTVYVDPSLGEPALQNAQDLLAAADGVVKQNNAIFGITGGAVDVIVFALNGRTDGTGGADHDGCDFTTGNAIEVDASYGNSTRVVALFEAELSECAMNGRLCGLSTGEALSRWCAAAVGSNALADFATAPQWASDGMPNWVDQTAPTDRDPDSTGCGMAFLSWLISQGHSLSQVAQAMVSLGDTGTLAQLFAQLTGRPASDAWATFKSAVDTLPNGVANDDPFNALPVQ